MSMEEKGIVDEAIKAICKWIQEELKTTSGSSESSIPAMIDSLVKLMPYKDMY